MADFNQINQFGSAKPARSGEGMSCAECEAMLTDAIDGTLTDKDRAAFEVHLATCDSCSQMLADARRGAALLEMLKTPRPEPSSSLIDRIIAQTSGLIVADSLNAVPAHAGIGTGLGSASEGIVSPLAGFGLVSALPGATTSNVLPFRSAASTRFNLHAVGRAMLQPRLAMTAAMAFFSVALTLNLTGVHLNELRASDLKPSSLKHSFYQADASLVRYYDNLRVVYELESRLSDLRQSNETDAPGAGKAESKDDSGKSKSGQDDHKKKPKEGSGTSQRSPLPSEFKLAADRLDGTSGRNSTVSTETDFAELLDQSSVTTNKSKELFQEGGLV